MRSIYCFLAAAMLLYSAALNAQTETDTTYATQMNYIFAHVDKTKVPYGILRDYGMEFINLDNFNGTAPLADSNYTDASVLFDTYNTLLMGQINSSANNLINPDTLNNRWSNYRQPGIITLAGLYFNYSQFRSDAAGNYITVSSLPLGVYTIEIVDGSYKERQQLSIQKQ